MKDVEKMIKDMNKITEADYKQNHIFMWEFIINRIKDTSLSISDNKNICLQEVEGEYLLKLEARLEEKEFLSEKDKWLLNMIKTNKGIQYNYFVCLYVVLNESYTEESTCLNSCPLMKSCGGKFEVVCIFKSSIYKLLIQALKEHNYEKAIQYATEIKNAWREVK